jgi:Holliday junction resolvase
MSKIKLCLHLVGGSLILVAVFHSNNLKVHEQAKIYYELLIWTITLVEYVDICKGNKYLGLKIHVSSWKHLHGYSYRKRQKEKGKINRKK